MIKIVDYGLGNVSAFINMYKRMNIPVLQAKTAADLEGASKLILPGVGAFDHAMYLLNRSGMRESLDQMVLVDKTPVIGICVGMQILANGSDEGTSNGLGWVPGHVRSFSSAEKSANLPLPHMGWNDVRAQLDDRLFDGIADSMRFYFLHSYYFKCENSADSI